MKNKPNISLIIGIIIPIAMILFVAGSIYLPGLFVKPSYNFLYVTYRDYYYGQYYSVQNSTLIKGDIYPNTNYGNQSLGVIKLYIHDVKANTNKEISFEDAQKLTIDSNSISPDGFKIVYGKRSRNDIFFPYSWNDKDSRYLEGHRVSKKLDLQLLDNSYNTFYFLGWIK